MLNVLLAEDEYLIREHMKIIVPWAEEGYHIVAEAEDGQEVLDFLETLDIDILILDIKMPFFTGIEILEYIHMNNKKVKVILATGHDKFEYAKKALDYGAIGYLLKPIKSNELKELLVKAKELIHKESALKYKNLFNSIKYNDSNLETLLTTFNKEIPWDSTLYVIIVRDLEIILNDKTICTLQYYLVQNNIRSMLLNQTKKTCTLLLFSKQTHISQILEKAIKISMRSTSLRMYMGNACKTASKLSTSYMEALECEESSMFLPDKVAFDYDFLTSKKDSSISFEDITKFLDKIEMSLRIQDVKIVKEQLHFLFQTLQKSHRVSLLKKVLYYFYFMLQNQELKDKDPEVYINELINRQDGLTEIQDEIYKHMESMIIRTKAPNILLVIKIKDYIETHYMKNTLGTEEIADFLNMNASYISTVFKKTLHYSITEYITKCRMKKAKILLEKNKFKIYEIAELVGYSDSGYFSNCFKKHYGLSPKHFLDLQI